MTQAAQRYDSQAQDEKIDRSRIIGGSDIAAVMGLNRWCTPLKLWALKTGKIKDSEQSEPAEVGKDLEEYVARCFVKKMDKKLRRDNRTFRHPEYEYMVAHIDRWVIGEDAGFEAKTASAYLAKEWADEDIPQEYVLQCIWYCGIVGKSEWYISVLIGGQKRLHKKILFDKALFEQQVAAAKHFMEEFILQDVPPVAMVGDSETLLQMFPESKKDMLQFDAEHYERINALVDDRRAGLEALQETKDAIDGVESQLKQMLGEAEMGETDKYRLSWKTQYRKKYTVEANSFRVFRTIDKNKTIERSDK